MTDSWGAGLPDYSDNAGVSTQRVIRGDYQDRYALVGNITTQTYAAGFFQIPSYILTLTNDLVVYGLEVKSTSNILLETAFTEWNNSTELYAEITAPDPTSRTYAPRAYYGRAYGYGKLNINWPKGIRFSSSDGYAYAVICNAYGDFLGQEYELQTTLSCFQDTTFDESQLTIYIDDIAGPQPITNI